ncbi:MAG: ABC transporter ATP-binding protein [Rhodobacteraceae bacterium]|nr:ABC transporter ATP-binding protein [Paracoccaceae bacterium]
MIEVQNLSVRVGDTRAVRRVNLSIGAGERLGVVGESGSGKTMLALALMGMVPDGLTVDGVIRIDGNDLSRASETTWAAYRAQKIAMIFQEPMSALNPLRRIGDIVAEPLLVHQGISRNDARQKVLALFDETGIPDANRRLQQYPHQLSGGQRQRVLIALALACDPSLLIADEPTTALDANIALRITDLLVRLSRERQMALLFISHDLSAVSRTTEDLLVMYGGDIVERGKTRHLLASPSHPYTSGLLSARPRIEQNAGPRRLPTIPGTVPSLFDLPPGCRFAGRCDRELPICRATIPQPAATVSGGFASCHLLNQPSQDQTGQAPR